MARISRRALWCSVSAVAVAAGAIYAAPSLSQIGKAKPVISFGEAKIKFTQSLRESIELSQTEFGIKYTPAQVEDIQTRAWGSAQAILAVHYDAAELPKDLQRLRPGQ